MIKAQSRVAAFSDGRLSTRFIDKPFVGSVYRGPSILEGILHGKVRWNGFDSGDAVVECLRKSSFRPQIRMILFDSAVFAGLNIVDLKKVHRSLDVPVAAIQSKPLNLEDLRSKIEIYARRYSLRALSAIGSGSWISIKGRKLYSYCIGMDKSTLASALSIYSETGIIQAIRTARVIAAELNRYLVATKRLN